MGVVVRSNKVITKDNKVLHVPTQVGLSWSQTGNLGGTIFAATVAGNGAIVVGGASSNKDTIWRSTDNAQTWTPIVAPSGTSWRSNEEGDIRCVTKDANGDALYAWARRGGDSYYQLIRSNDHGLTWQTVGAPFNTSYSVIDKLAVNGNTVVSTDGTYVMYSTNGGESFTVTSDRVNTPISYLKNAGKFVYGRYDTHYICSSADGINWQNTSVLPNGTISNKCNVVECPQTNEIYVGKQYIFGESDSEPLISKSATLDGPWTNINTGLSMNPLYPNRKYHAVYDIAFYPNDLNQIVIAEVDGTNNARLIRRSADGGLTWSTVHTMTDPVRVLYVGQGKFVAIEFLGQVVTSSMS